jgi:hypothetical protein
MNTIVRYIRDLSIVIAGIAVTLYFTGRITNQSEKRDIGLYLNAIKIEMEENIKIVNEAIEYIQPSVRYSAYLYSHDKESLNKDTIKSYLTAFYTSQSFTFKTNAFEMFKSSGTMRLMNDKNLLLSIWDMYAKLTDLKELFDWCDQIKKEAMMKEASMAVVVKDGKPTLQLDDTPMYSFYITGITLSMLSESEKVLKEAQEFVEKL